jgi:hypothetical protein
VLGVVFYEEAALLSIFIDSVILWRMLQQEGKRPGSWMYSPASEVVCSIARGLKAF